jgi:hypothetical protein
MFKLILSRIKCWERRDEEEQWRRVNSSMIYLIHCKNLCKCYSIPPQHNNKKGEKE